MLLSAIMHSDCQEISISSNKSIYYQEYNIYCACVKNENGYIGTKRVQFELDGAVRRSIEQISLTMIKAFKCD